MAFKDPTDYAFGQLGSIHVRGTNAVTLIGGDDTDVTPASNVNRITKVFVAITFLEDSVFESSSGLIAENVKHFPSTEGSSLGIDLNGGLVADSIMFPAGLTIYGRWTQIDLNSGKCIAYIGY